MSHVLGVDGGNTKTIALVSTLDGTIVGAGRGGCSDIYGAVSAAAAVEQIGIAIDEALDRAELTRQNLTTAYLCLAGADWPEDYAFLYDAALQWGLGDVTIGNDSLGALRAGSPDGTGVVITCGTGIATGARNAAGDFWQSGFWQESLCGIELGRLALRAIYRAELRIDPPTSLTGPVLAQFGQPNVEALLHNFWNRETPPPDNIEVSRIAPLVLDAAEAGDTASARIVRDHGLRLAEYAIAAARQVRLDASDATFALVLNGGIFRHPGRMLIQAIVDHIALVYPQVTPLRSRYEPAVGALLLALEAAGVEVTDAIMARVQQSHPPGELFLT